MTDKTTFTVTIDEDLEDLIPGFLENRKNDVEKLRGSITNNDLKMVQSIGHSLKGVGGGYGFDEITRLGAAIETAAKDEIKDDVEKAIEELEHFLNHVEIKFE